MVSPGTGDLHLTLGSPCLDAIPWATWLDPLRPADPLDTEDGAGTTGCGKPPPDSPAGATSGPCGPDPSDPATNPVPEAGVGPGMGAAGAGAGAGGGMTVFTAGSSAFVPGGEVTNSGSASGSVASS